MWRGRKKMNLPFEEIKSFIRSIVSLSDDDLAEIVDFIEVKSITNNPDRD
jgi:hypothetical protein